MAALFGLGVMLGGGFGPCGPNDAGMLLLAAILPGLPILLRWPNLAKVEYFGEVVVVVAAILGYALLVLIVRQGWRFIRTRRAHG